MTPCNAVSPSGLVCQRPANHTDAMHHVALPASLDPLHLASFIEWSDQPGPQMSFAEFSDMYATGGSMGGTKWSRITWAIRHRHWYTLAFELRIRTADVQGYFERGRWCLPWNWYRLYYEARIPPGCRS